MEREPDAVHQVPAELDIVSVDEFAELLASADDGAVVHVDCSDVTFIDSSGLRVLVLARNRQRSGGGDLVVVTPSANVRRVFEVAGLAELMQSSDQGPS